MRLHTDTITMSDVYAAMREAGVYVDDAVTEHGSRKRDHAFNVKLLGNSRRRPNGGSYGAGGDYAATWDQWGIFLAALYRVDPRMSCWAYANEDDFHYRTAYRFEDFTLADSHGDHTFRWQGVPCQQGCTKCDAVVRWDV